MNMGNGHEITEQYRPEINEIALYLGNKCLTLSLPKPDAPEFIDSIVNLPDDFQPIPGATTTLYQRASEIMQDTANKLEQPLTYTFMTDNARMIEWARVHGRRIFDWTARYDGEEEYVAGRIFVPEK